MFVPPHILAKFVPAAEPRCATGATHWGRLYCLCPVVDRVLDAASGTIGVRLPLLNPRLALPRGIRCRVAFVLEGENPALMTGDAPLIPQK